VRLLGRPRAELLEALRSPATPTDLARVLGVTPSAVSQHLRVLRGSGLVARERIGGSVLYMTTPLGMALASSAAERELAESGAGVVCVTDQTAAQDAARLPVASATSRV
jgi:DNA-binding transcriptional ArsR family regulator